VSDGAFVATCVTARTVDDGTTAPCPVWPHSAFLGFVTGSKPFFRSRRSPCAGFECCTEWDVKQGGQNMPLQMPHVSVCDSHNSLPQSEHCVLAVLEQR